MMADSGMTEGAGIIVKLPAKSSSSTEVFSSIDFSSNDRLDLLLPVPEEHAMSDYRTKMHDDYKVDDDDDGKSQDSNDEENSAHLMEKKYRELMLVENQLNQSGNNDTTSGGGNTI